jgi:hypothetical protein
MGRKGLAIIGICPPTNTNTTNFVLLNPDFFFGRQRASAKAPLPFFWGGVVFINFFSLSKFLFDLRRISVGVFSELKVPKSKGRLLKPGKLGPL